MCKELIFASCDVSKKVSLGKAVSIMKKPVREKIFTFTNPMVSNSNPTFTFLSKLEWTTPLKILIEIFPKVIV